VHPQREPLVVGSNPKLDLVVVRPEYLDTESASGLALVAHELVHNWQRLAVPNFSERYAFTAEAISNRGLPPWENPYEAQAYTLERELRDILLGNGWPEGPVPQQLGEVKSGIKTAVTVLKWGTVIGASLLTFMAVQVALHPKEAAQAAALASRAAA